MGDDREPRAPAELVDQLKQELGEVPGRAMEKWPERARSLLEYVARPERAPVASYGAIRELLDTHWEIPVVETPTPVSEMDPLIARVRDQGRCGVRLLDLLGNTDVYIVVRREQGTGTADMLWTLLHELGHFANHFEMLQSISTAYQRICLNPALEGEIGRFARRAGRTLRSYTELEADLFALDWLVPRWTEDGWAQESREGFTLDGYRFHSLRRALGVPNRGGSLSATTIASINRAGEEEGRRNREAPLSSDTRWSRASWLLWNRHRFGDRRASSELLAEYYAIVGKSGRHVPELRQPVLDLSKFDPDSAWLRRIHADDATSEVEGDRWAPLLVSPSESIYPEYNLPIRPLPSRDPRDGKVRWSHMLKPSTQKSLSLEAWTQTARAEGAGLLLFPRNPAERKLDEGGVARP